MSSDDHGLLPAELAEAARPAIAEAKGKPARDAARILAEAGLTGVCAQEDDGGMALGLPFSLAIAEEAGAGQLRFPLLDQILLAQAFAGQDIAGRIAAGEALGLIGWEGARDGLLRLSDDCDCDVVLVPTGQGADLIERAGLTGTPTPLLDPDAPQVWLDVGAARKIGSLTLDQMADLRRAGEALYGGFVTGAAANALALSSDYLAARVQFGRPLSSKQAVRHHLARMKLLLEMSRAALTRSLARDELGNPRDTRPAFLGAVGNAVWTLEKAIHLHGGMGFTWEVPLHYSLRDIRKIETAFGAGRLARQVAQDFIRAA
ncbi:acyl-CoA dehydrogenase family protein [Paracoccus sp. SY]|uniref:acyl-CoA dehydrogenase family protein n=1 Tax=Paracoccus sp. SY TaxID=1330255 RepID=UPI000CD0EACF|nr:acyl-CoA dehydrogenase family protein [Paracoccus sp. SY]